MGVDGEEKFGVRVAVEDEDENRVGVKGVGDEKGEVCARVGCFNIGVED